MGYDNLSSFIFYSIGLGKTRLFTLGSHLKHSSVIVYDGGICLHYELRENSYLVTPINKELSQIIKRYKSIRSVSAIITVDVKQFHPKWFPILANSCSDYCRRSSGIDVGITITPGNLYNKLLKYNGKRNFRVVTAWRR